MTFDEVIQRVTANQGQSFTGIQLRADGNYLGIYTVSTSADDEDDPEEVHIHFEGGPLFADYGEEDAYSLDNAPDVVRLLTYQPTASLPDVGGLTPEYALHIFLPQLPDPEGIWRRNDRIRFTAVALVAAKASGCVTITAKDSSPAALSHVEPSRANADAHRNSGGARRKRHIPFGLKEGALVRATDVENGKKCECICPGCKGALIAANAGEIRIPHFKHTAERTCLNGYEVGVLQAAKEVLAKNGGLLLPPFTVMISGEDLRRRATERTVGFGSTVVTADRVDIDPACSRTKPDVVFHRGGRELHINIRVSLAEGKGKRRKLQASGPSTLEIDLSNVGDETLNAPDQFEQIVLLHPENRYWIRHLKGSQLVEEAKRALDAEIEARNRQIREALEKQRPAISNRPIQIQPPKISSEVAARSNVRLLQENYIEQKMLREQRLISNYQSALSLWGGQCLQCQKCYLISGPSHYGDCLHCGSSTEYMKPISVTRVLIQALSEGSDLTVIKSLKNAPNLREQD